MHACTPRSESNRYQVVSGQMLDPKESVSKVENINILFLESNSSLWVGKPQRNVSFCFYLLQACRILYSGDLILKVRSAEP